MKFFQFRIIGAFLTYLYLVLFNSCTENVCSEIRAEWKIASSDQFINNQEFERIFQKSKNSPGCNIQSSSPCALETYWRRLNPESKFESQHCNTRIPKLRLFIENSDSMDGFIRGNNEFKDHISYLLVRLKSLSSQVEYNFINGNIYPIKLSLENFIRELSLDPGRSYIKNKSSTFGSDINSLFKRIVQTLGEDEIGIFITDGIYSIGSSENIKNELNSSQNFTMDTFLEGIKLKNLSTIVLQYESSFNGNYYDMKHSAHAIHSKKPFYIFILGSDEILFPLWKQKSKEIISYRGVQNHSIFRNEPTHKVKSILLSQYNKIGTKKIKDRNNNLIGEINPGPDGKFSVSLAVDLSTLQGIDESVSNSDSYEIPNNCKLEVTSYAESELSNNDKIFIKKFDGIPTHLFSLICEKSAINMSTITIALKKYKNRWWKNHSLQNDTDSKSWIEFKTFGLENLVDGISDAYDEYKNTDTIFSIPIYLEK